MNEPELPQPAGEPPVAESPRARAVRRAIEAWTRELIDLGGRNTLLHFRELKVGTLNLGAADLASRDRFFGGRSVRLSELFLDEAVRRDAAKRARTIRAKAVENDEERGVQTLYLARGFATWTSDRTAAVANAPVVLQRLTMRPTGPSGDDFHLEIDGDAELSPTLLHLLLTDFGVRVDVDPAHAEADASMPAGGGVDVLTRELQRLCSAVPGFKVVAGAVIANFSYTKLPMVRDLERAQAEIEGHALLSAIAGDPEGSSEVRARHTNTDSAQVSPVPPPADEFLVLDADSSQSRVIAAAVSGADLVVVGPPGTGKSQTISNLIATLVARGKSVLFVAEKRAAIDAVVGRLEREALGDLILDLHDGASNRRRVAGELHRAMSLASSSQAPNVAELQGGLTQRRGQLESYERELHELVEPWGISAYQAQDRIIGIPAAVRIATRLRLEVLEALTPQALASAADDIEAYVRLGGRRIRTGASPWSAAYATSQSYNQDAIGAMLEVFREVNDVLFPRFAALARDATTRVGLPAPSTFDDAEREGALLLDTHEVTAGLGLAAFDLDLPSVERDLEPSASGAVGRFFARLSSGRYRRARSAVKALDATSRLSDRRTLELVRLGRSVKERWAALTTAGTRPSDAAAAADLDAARDALEAGVASLRTVAGIDLALTGSLEAFRQHLEALNADHQTLFALPGIHLAEDHIVASGLGDVLADVVASDLGPAEARQALTYVWTRAVLDRLLVTRSALSLFDGVAQEAAVDGFIDADHAHIESGSRRVQRAWAERVTALQNEYPEQAAQIARQAALQRRHMPLRDLFGAAEQVLVAVKPCWVMSPLVVAQVLPTRECFDVVVFDEASQITPADAASSLLRGRQAIVAGDPHQLPPTNFFQSTSFEDDDEERPLEEDGDTVAPGTDSALTTNIESVLDVMRTLLPPPFGQRTLKWHYRSRDERLITFSNAQELLYDWSLTTFPGALAGDCLQHVAVPYRGDTKTSTASSPDEVARVVELVIEHARTRPHESLGVIALGSPHATALTEALRLAARTNPELDAIQSDELAEPLFVKNLERVQGDERDAIILTVGYGRGADGRMRYNFGPVNQSGGYRRLNVAITRARRRMTVVSSFSAREMDPARVTSDGARMLRDYLLYAESNGTNLGSRARPPVVLNAFERDVQAALEGLGMRVEPQFGASDYRIDFAVMHPDRPGEPLLAVEADGASYHSSPTARDRDRLRQEHLERLGWHFHRIWSTDWFRSRDHEIARLRETYELALHEASAPAVAAAALPVVLDTPLDEEIPDPVRARRPRVPAGRPIGEYSHAELRSIVQWIQSDGLLRTDAELLRSTMEELGFRRRGPHIVAAIERAIEASRATGD